MIWILLVYSSHGQEQVQGNVGEGPGVEEGGEQPVKHDEDAGVLGVVEYKSPVEFAFRIILPTLLLFQNLKLKNTLATNYMQ